jgi:acetate kinase
MIILVVNAGSSSLRLAAYQANPGLGLVAADHVRAPERPDVDVFHTFARRHQLAEVSCVVHRVVHGGARFDQPVRIDSDVEAEIERLNALAPLHNPVSLAWIRAARAFVPAGTPEVAAFDTAFYNKLPDVAASYALPAELCQRYGIRRYGFHGLAHQSMLESWTSRGGDPQARIISLQLGSGCSITASRGTQPLDTSMGFSPLEGLMMATRSGDLDPAVVLYLLEQDVFTRDSLLELLNRGSGLLGVSGQSADMDELLGSDTPGARRAVALFCYRVRKYLGAYLAVLGGADAVLLGGGIAEHSSAIRARVLDGFEWAGLRLDHDANQTLPPAGGPIHQHASATATLVTPVDEMIMMARAALRLLHTG